MNCGSSPRARGTPIATNSHDASVRLIPAGAGNTLNHQLPITQRGAHPRGRGEHWIGDRWRDMANGSSPRARGTHLHGNHVRVREGLIPAGAGNTSQQYHAPASNKAHPRGRGEHIVMHDLHATPSGSSPRARGTLPNIRTISNPRRLIPAGAGNTMAWTWPTCQLRAHPRGRGEHTAPTAALYPLRGSSPRARGTHLMTCSY